MPNSTPPADTDVPHTTTTIAIKTPASQRLHLKKTAFFDLPAELRNNIYEIILGRQRRLQVIEMPAYVNSRIRLNSTKLYTSILRACKAIKDEATLILYGDSRFSFRSSPTARLFLKTIGNSAEYVHYLEILGVRQMATLQDFMSLLAIREHLVATPCIYCPFLWLCGRDSSQTLPQASGPTVLGCN